VLQGTLDDFALTDVFRLLSAAQKTGRLDVVRQAGAGKVFFNGGDVYYAESSLVREPLGQKLVRSGALTEGQLRRALDEHASTGRRLGQVLLSSGTVSPKELEDAVRAQTEDSVFDLLRWERGKFVWEPGEEIDVEIPIAVSVENLIMEASRRLDELDVIRRKIPSDKTLVAMASKPPEGAVEINITPDEWRVLVLVNGIRTVDDIATGAGLDEFDATRTLFGLVSAGLLEVISNSAGGSDVDERHSAIRPEADTFPDTIEAGSPDDAGVAAARPEEPVETGTPASEERAPVAPLDDVVPSGEAEDSATSAEEEPVVRLEDLAPDRVVVPMEESEPAPEAVSDAWFGDPAGAALAGEAPIGSEEALVGPAEAAFEAGVEPGRGNGAFEPDAPSRRSDDAPLAPPPPAGESFPPSPLEETPEPPARPPAPQVAESPGGPEEEVRLDRSAVVRELAGLFSEGAPAPSAREPQEAPSPPPPDERKRVEDDDQVTKGLISRLIDGVKGL
jgi:hypothetical protein